MPNTQIVGASRAYGLDSLNDWIKENEQLLGPLVRIGDGGSATAAEFDLAPGRLKAKFAKLSLKVGDASVVAQDHELVCEGEAYIVNQLMPVCVTRPK